MLAKAMNSPAAARARTSSFYFAMRMLPRAQREAMFEIYSFCRAVDDIADGDMPRLERLNALSEWRRDIEGLYIGQVPAGLAMLAHAIERFGLRKADFLAIIDGVEMDAAEDICAPEMQRLDLYCDRVASAVGRLSVRVFGMDEKDGIDLSHHLGRALQLTNILRDIDEDAAIGRLYLPREALQQAGIHATIPQQAVSHPALGVACEIIVDRAMSHFSQAAVIMARSPRKVVRAPRIMEKAYRHLLMDMVKRGWREPRQRVRISRLHLFKIILQYAFI